MISTTLLFAQVVRERYTRTAWQSALLLAGVIVYFALLGLIFKWIGADVPPE